MPSFPNSEEYCPRGKTVNYRPSAPFLCDIIKNCHSSHLLLALVLLLLLLLEVLVEVVLLDPRSARLGAPQFRQVGRHLELDEAGRQGGGDGDADHQDDDGVTGAETHPRGEAALEQRVGRETEALEAVAGDRGSLAHLRPTAVGTARGGAERGGAERGGAGLARRDGAERGGAGRAGRGGAGRAGRGGAGRGGAGRGGSRRGRFTSLSNNASQTRPHYRDRYVC